MNRYHWFVLIVAALGWLFDCLDQQLFILARPAAMKDLIPDGAFSDPKTLDLARRQGGDIATSIFIAGWATGGLIFGMLGDRIGRAKTMVITILMYSLFTGLSSISTGLWDFALYRFLTGLGVGGEFAVGVALVAEVMPGAARPYALGLLQALSAIGNISAAFINLGLGIAEEHGLPYSPWRIMFMIGAVPALLALVIRRRLKEPEKWQQASHEGAVEKRLGSYRELFRDPLLRKHALLGLVLGCSGIIGLWSVGFFTPDLIRFVQRKQVAEDVYTAHLATARTAGDTARVAQ
ncbi:MAG: MFS transporter, partial [Planctomycetaceae bacterium]|nr:MFS transporter [Planctomycetaceae bacterium]